MHTRRFLIALVFAVSCLCLGSGAFAASLGYITVRGDFNYPPYEYLDGGVPTGFNVDVMRAVAQAMNLRVKIDLGPWNEVRQQIENGEVDALTGMYYSPDRDRVVDFSSPHIIVNHAIFVRKGSSITSLDDLKGKDVVVQNGDIMHDYALANLRDSTIYTVESQDDALTLIHEGKHDAALLGKLQNLYLAEKRGLDDLITVGPPIEPRRYCIAVREGDEALLAAVNEGLKLIKISGEYQRIHDHWFGVYEQRSLKEKLFKHLLVAGTPLLLLLLGGAIWTWTLRRAVRERTAELHESRERFREVVEGSPLGMALVGQDGSIRLINRELTRMLGYTIDDVPTLDVWWETAYPDGQYRRKVYSLWTSAVAAARVSPGPAAPPREWQVRGKDGATRDIEFRTTWIGDEILVILTDVTESKRTAEILVQSEKMLSVGGLAAGMAHEINNPLGGILQGVQNVIRRFSPDIEANRSAAEQAGCGMDALQDYIRKRRIDTMLEGIRDSGQRAAHIVANMLSFSRKSESHYAPLDIRELMDRAITLAESDYDLQNNYDFRKIEIVREYPAEPVRVECTETEMVQVFFNLLRNAAQAMFRQGDRQEPGRIRIVIRNDGEAVVITVADNGPGMSEEVRRRVFEPFFTTKPPGVGTGLGLSVTFFIVTRSHDGAISVESAPGAGTTFTIALPVRHVRK